MLLEVVKLEKYHCQMRNVPGDHTNFGFLPINIYLSHFICCFHQKNIYLKKFNFRNTYIEAMKSVICEVKSAPSQDTLPC